MGQILKKTLSVSSQQLKAKRASRNANTLFPYSMTMKPCESYPLALWASIIATSWKAKAFLRKGSLMNMTAGANASKMSMMKMSLGLVIGAAMSMTSCTS